VGIFPLGQFFGLTGNRPQSAPACSFLRYGAFKTPPVETLSGLRIFSILEIHSLTGI